jgi:hypothetical protein
MSAEPFGVDVVIDPAKLASKPIVNGEWPK